MTIQVSPEVVAHLRLQQAMRRAGLWQSRAQPRHADPVGTVTAGGGVTTTWQHEAAEVRRWFRDTEPSERDRALRSIAWYLPDGEAVLARYTSHRRRLQTVTTAVFTAVAFLAGIVIAGVWGWHAAGTPVTSVALLAIVVAAVKVSYTVESLSTLELAASLAQAQHTAEAAIGDGSDGAPTSRWDALVRATSSAIEGDQPIADEALDFVDRFVRVRAAQTDTAPLTSDQYQLMTRYGPHHPDPDIAAAVQRAQAQDRQHRHEQQTLDQRRAAIEDEAQTVIDRIELEQDKITAAAVRHLTQRA